MPETLEVAAPSAAPVTAEPTLEIPRSNSPEYVEWRKTGELPKNGPKTADPAPADPPKEVTSEADKPEPAPDPESGKKQERRKPDAEARIGELTARLKQVERDLEEARKPKEAAKQPEPKAPQNYQEYRKSFKAQEWVSKYAEANPEASYEEAQAAMVDHLADARDYFRSIDQQRQAQASALEAKLKDARARYENFDDIQSGLLSKIITPKGEALVPQNVFDILNDSDVLPDLLYTIGSDEAETSKFLEMAKSSPTKAIRYVAKMEALIEAELSKPRNDKGQFQAAEPEKAPAKRGPESAPAPPLEVGSRGTGPMDEADRAFQAIERGDPKAVRAFLDAENRKDLARRRGA